MVPPSSVGCCDIIVDNNNIFAANNNCSSSVKASTTYHNESKGKISEVKIPNYEYVYDEESSTVASSPSTPSVTGAPHRLSSAETSASDSDDANTSNAATTCNKKQARSQLNRVPPTRAGRHHHNVAPEIPQRFTTSATAKGQYGRGILPKAFTIVIEHLVGIGSGKEPLTRFHCVKRPGIEIGDYIRRLAKHFGCSDEVFVLCLIYIDRAIKRDDTFAVSALNVHRLVLTALTIAAKFHDDIYYSNAFYARVGGVSVSELNTLELTLLKMMDWQCFVPTEEYEMYERSITMTLP
ncbi:mitochondrial peripheral inner membrane protein [Perkinsus chesapeaki]|uniref:Mitochondrial peripheral inner membrane protein n=1 Tax=Perkinsus chesapeaki TaxID=330153 RepID=A0A7J6KZ49_PERCH|nr:mitochondrial peripheral inner membrane protein [Perkinsus chesapeaki]